MSTLTTAVEKSTYVVDLSFTDEDGTAVVPDTITWSIRDNAGNIVNSRDAVSATPASTVTIVLSGDDLAYDAYTKTARTLTIEATYTSTAGAGLPLKDEHTIPIRGLVGV